MHECRVGFLPWGSILAALVAAVLLLLSAQGTRADESSVEAFYRGRQITLYIGMSPGAAYDIDARLVAKNMSKYIPGNPAIVPKQMTGAGSMLAIAFAYNAAPHDGTVMVAPLQGVPLQQVLGEPSAKADLSKFNWIGTPIQDNNVVITWHTSGVTSVEDARKRVVTLGTNGVHDTAVGYAEALNTLAGTKFKIIGGYRGGSDADLAMQRGEVGGRGSANWDGLKLRPGWIADKKINVLVQIGLTRAKDLPDAPLLTDFAANDQDRAALRLLSAPAALGHPLLMTPDVPAERVEAVRKAFDLTMKDPDFLADATKARRDIDPISGIELQRVVDELVRTPKEVVDRLLAIIGQAPAR
jgi:tripartite-type tricarboxylate transporter receptor subunit TctC